MENTWQSFIIESCVINNSLGLHFINTNTFYLINILVVIDGMKGLKWEAGIEQYILKNNINVFNCSKIQFLCEDN